MKAITLPYCLVLMLLTASIASAQKFVTVDNDTHEFIEDVNYTLYKEGKITRHGITLNDAATIIDGKEFDSISFSRVDYDSKGFLRDSLPEAVFLTKRTIQLDEVVISPQKDKEIVLGETNRIVKSRATQIDRELVYGIMLSNDRLHTLELTKAVFYIGKIKHKTAYRIKLYEAGETTADVSRRFLDKGELAYASDILYVSRKDDKRVEVSLPAGLMLAPGKSLFAHIELVGYYDKDGKGIAPDNNEKTKMAFQFSDKVNYFTKMANSKGELTDWLVNINVMINYDFAYLYQSKPHKSVLVSPAMVLYAKQAQ